MQVTGDMPDQPVACQMMAGCGRWSDRDHTTLEGEFVFVSLFFRQPISSTAMTNTTNTHLPTIVYVEDNEGDALLLEEALRARGHASQLLVIDRGDQALHYFEVKESAKDVPPPHCILLDSHLPMVTGTELLRFVRGCRSFDQTPVYIFSAKTGYLDAIRTGMVSDDCFLTKPRLWDGFLLLADHLMRSAEVSMRTHETPAANGGPELAAPAALKRPEAK